MAPIVTPPNSTIEGPNGVAATPSPTKKRVWRIIKELSWLVPTIVGAFAGAAIQYYIQMARPQATLLDVRLPSPEQVRADKDKQIQVPFALLERIRKSDFFAEQGEELEQQSTRQKIESFAEGVTKAKLEIPDQLAWIDNWSPRLDGNLTVEDQTKFLQEMADHDIDVILKGGLARKDDRYTPSVNERVGSRVFQYKEVKQGFVFDVGSIDWPLDFGPDSLFSARLKPAVDAIATFNQKYLKRVLSNAREDLKREDSDATEITDQINKLINHNEGLHVRVLVVNKGGSPVSLTPWGTLRLFAAGNQPDIVIPLRASEDSYPSIKPGESQELNLESVESAEKIELEYPLIENILKTETVMSRVALQRADITGDRGWIRSSTRTLTAHAGAEQEARRVGLGLSK